MTIESEGFVLTKGGVYVGKRYLCGGMFKANVAIVGKNTSYDINNNNASS